MNKKDSTTAGVDSKDLALLTHIQHDARISNSKLSEKLNLSETPCWRRWKNLEEEGYIEEYRAILNRKKLGFQITGFTQVSLGSHEETYTDTFEQFVKTTPWIPLCHCITGGADFLVQIVARDLDEYYDRISLLRKVRGVNALHTSVSVKEIKSDAQVPLG